MNTGVFVYFDSAPALGVLRIVHDSTPSSLRP